MCPLVSDSCLRPRKLQWQSPESVLLGNGLCHSLTSLPSVLYFSLHAFDQHNMYFKYFSHYLFSSMLCKFHEAEISVYFNLCCILAPRIQCATMAVCVVRSLSLITPTTLHVWYYYSHFTCGKLEFRGVKKLIQYHTHS